MREYSKIAPSFWTGETGKKIRAMGQDCVVTAMYLMTSPHANMYGLYYIPIPYICHETGLTEEGASKALRRLFEGGFCHYDPISEWVFVMEMAKYQILERGEPLDSKDNRVKGINRDYSTLPNNPFLFMFYERYKDDFHLEKPRGKQAPSKPLESPFEAPSKPGAGTGAGERTGKGTEEAAADISTTVDIETAEPEPTEAEPAAAIQNPMSISEIQNLYVQAFGKIDINQPKVSVFQYIAKNFPRDKIEEAFQAVPGAGAGNLNWVVKRLENRREDIYDPVAARRELEELAERHERRAADGKQSAF